MKKIYASILSLFIAASVQAIAADIPANAVCYDGSTPGSLVIDMGTGDTTDGQGTGNVYITPVSDGLVDFLLPDLTLPGLGTLGDIELTNVTTTTEADGTVVYNATVEDMSLLGGAIHAKVVLANGDGKSCTTDAAGNAHFNIDVIWYMDYPANTQEMPIYVTFKGKQTSLGFSDIATDDTAAPEYFDLQGNTVNADALVPGQTYIKRQNGTAIKFVAL